MTSGHTVNELSKRNQEECQAYEGNGRVIWTCLFSPFFYFPLPYLIYLFFFVCFHFSRMLTGGRAHQKVSLCIEPNWFAVRISIVLHFFFVYRDSRQCTNREIDIV